ncbi:MAG: MobF family relaxase, partial [Marmoricola sp.]
MVILMTVHKLSAGDGYTYLTRQVASADERRRRGQSLTDYYLDQGNPPGTWVGKGAAQLGVAGSEVTESQMRALFGQGLHPDGVTKLGAAYPNYADLAPYADRVAARIEGFTQENGRPPSEFARSRIAAMEARRGRRAVAGYDLVFTPVKSASLLWALGGPEMQAAVEGAHHEAVTNVVGWLEEHAAYTRVGRGGHAQIDTTGLVCVAFDHRESRAGDPDLHTHLAIANKVCGVDGKWRSLDARVLYALGVAASERYNTRFEDALARRAGVTFVERAGGRSNKRPVREIDGVLSELIRHFSRRRAAIEDRYTELRAEYRSDHGREPDQSAQIRLAQQATLETRESKGEARGLTEQISDWRRQAVQVVGNRRFARFVRECTGKGEQVRRPSTAEIAELAAQVVRRVSEQRSTWTVWNVLAEA